MNPEEIKTYIISAFTPYKCKANLVDYDESINFKVLAENGDKIIEIEELNIHGLTEKQLDSLVATYKVQIEALGFTFG